MHKELKGWIEFLGITEPILTQISGDEKSKRYYRIEKKVKKFFVMDASQDTEIVPRMIGIGLRLKETRVKVALVRSFELHKGFMLLSDVGSTHLYDKCSSDNPSSYYEKAIRTLVEMQDAPTINLTQYDEGFLIEEMNLMLEWYLKAYLGKTLECVEGRNLLESFSTIAREVLAQPQEVFVHTDYHSKNIMLDDEDDIVIIDYQDAKEGALTYDLASLLCDGYVALDARERRRFIMLFKELKGIEVDDETFMRWFDFSSLQRNIKLLGVFARLEVRDERKGYIEHTPLLLQYILNVAEKYPELSFLENLLRPDEKDSKGFSFS